jgi:hypothetical protein
LIYLYALIKASSQEFALLNTYSNSDPILLRYKLFISQVDIIKFIEKILFYMRSLINFKGNINTFFHIILKFKSENPFFSDKTLTLDQTIIEKIFNNPYKDSDLVKDNNIEFYDYLHKSVELIFDIYKPSFYTDGYKTLINEFFIPLLKGLNRKNFDITNLELSLIDLNTILLMKYLNIQQQGLIKGGGKERKENKRNRVMDAFDTVKDTIDETLNYTKKLVVGDKNENNDQYDENKREETMKDKENNDRLFVLERLKKINKFIKNFNSFTQDSEFEINLSKPSNNNDDQNTQNQTKIKTNYEKGILSKFEANYNKYKVIESMTVNGEHKKNVDIDNISYPEPSKEQTFSSEINAIKNKIENNKYKVDKINTELQANDSSVQIKIKEFKKELSEIQETILPELQSFKNSDDTLIKLNLSNFFTIDENSNPGILDDISDYIQIYESIIDEYKRGIEELLNKYNNQIRIIQSLESSYNTVLQNKGYANIGKFVPPIPGGNKKDTKYKMKGGDLYFNINENDINKRKDKLKKIDKIENDFKKFKALTTAIASNEDNEEILDKFYDKTGDNIFERILYQYEKDSKNSLPEIAKGKLYDAAVDNNLDPEIELQVNFYDKLIFIVLIIVIRFFTLYITNYYIDGNSITTVAHAMIYYNFIYLIIFLCFFAVINIDIFRLRVIFNYMNMHINSSLIFVHIFLAIIIGYIVYLLIINISPENKPSRLSKNQKIKLKLRIDILTITIMTLLIIFVLVV